MLNLLRQMGPQQSLVFACAPWELRKVNSKREPEDAQV
jgi:hypothetical protein